MKLYYAGIRKFYFYLVYLAWMSYFNPIYKKKYARLEDALCVMKKNYGKFGCFYDERYPYRFIKFYIAKPRLFFNLGEEIERKKQTLFKKYSKRFSSKYLRKLKDNELLKIYNEFFDLMRRLFYLNQVIWHLDISGYQFLRNEMLKQDYNIENINLLTQPDKKNYLKEEEIEFLKLCLRYFKNRKTVNLHCLLENHLKKFAYIGVSYYKEPPREENNYRKQISKYLKEKRNWQYFKKIIEEQKKDSKKRIRMRDKMYNEIRNTRLKKAILILREAAWCKDYFRGSISEIIYYYFDVLLKELARHLKITQDQIKTLNNRELERLMKGKKLSWKEINQRQKYYASGTFNHKLFLYYGKKAKQIENKYFAKPKSQKVSKLKGISAQRGITKGRAKIILSYDDFKKFKEGDILIANNTMPEYMPIIRKAKAIVTEIGGITCHAAIVSRELKKPCIIGVKNATNIIKDGDEVEVDADEGIIKILKKK